MSGARETMRGGEIMKGWRARPLKRRRAAAPWPVAAQGGLAIAAVWLMCAGNVAQYVANHIYEAPPPTPPTHASAGLYALLVIIVGGLALGALAAIAALIAAWAARPWMAARRGRITPPRRARRAAVVLFHLSVAAGWTSLVWFGTVLTAPLFLALLYPLTMAGDYYRVWDAGSVRVEIEGLDELQDRARDRARSAAYGVVFAAGLALVVGATFAPLTWQVKLFAAALWMQLFFVLPRAIMTWSEPDHDWSEVDDDGVVVG